MAIGWLTVLRTVPWGEVIGNAPKVADGAKKLWNAVAGRAPADAPEAAFADAAAASPGDAPSTAAPRDAAIAELRAQLGALHSTAADLRAQMLASTELIQALAEQNTQLIQRAEVQRVRLQWLAAAVGVAAAVALGALVLVLSR